MEEKISALRSKASQLTELRAVIEETQKLQQKMRDLHLTGQRTQRTYSGLTANYASLKKHGIELDQLTESYERLGRATRGLEMKAGGLDKWGKSLDLGKSAFSQAQEWSKPVMKVVKVSADYQAVMRDFSIKAGIKNQAEEQRIGNALADAAVKGGMGQTDMAKAMAQLVGDGMKANDATALAPLLAQFSVGQGVGSEQTAALMGAISDKTGLTSPAQMKAALSAIAQVSKSANIDPAEMAKAMPNLLHRMKKLGLTGQDAIDQAAALLQAQVEKDGSVAEAEKSLKDKFKKWDAKDNQTALSEIKEETKRPDDKSEGKPKVKASAEDILQNDHQQRLDTSKQKWDDVGNSMDNAMRKIGDAIRPMSDVAAEVASGLANAVGDLAQAAPKAVMSVVGLGAAFSAFKLGKAGFGLLRGGSDVVRGSWLSRGKLPGMADAAAAAADGKVQQVFVTNWPGSGGESFGKGKGKKGKGKAGGAQAGRPGTQQAGTPAANRGARGMLGRIGGRIGGSFSGLKARTAGLWSQVSGVAGRAMPWAGRASKLLGGAGIAIAGVQAVRTLTGDGKPRDKASAIGRMGAMAVGGLVGTALGGPVGTALGSLAGEWLWSKVGDKALNYVPKSLMQEKDAPSESTSAQQAVQQAKADLVAKTAATAAGMAMPGIGFSAGIPAGAAASALMGQMTPGAGAANPAKAAAAPPQINFTPSITVNVQGDARDPAVLADKLAQLIFSKFKDFQDQQSRSLLGDTAHLQGA
ncbi:phage tail tape measure protein [Massilia sp. BJB1822]|uniref:phage tail tape measure protein n=1 Tax=Massilia sp. BJB1822 TaxID=2744470 RepID=UPI0015948E3D|nr:phage tail tape measure protein [Massilia sp. BJB1822]NVE01624.1 phage tail tape measure protein [Massilia sp. BJB1822]